MTPDVRDVRDKTLTLLARVLGKLRDKPRTSRTYRSDLQRCTVGFKMSEQFRQYLKGDSAIAETAR